MEGGSKAQRSHCSSSALYFISGSTHLLERKEKMMIGKVRLAVVGLCGALVLGGSAPAHADFLGLELEVAVGGWQPALSGDFSYQGNTLDDGVLGLDADTEIMARIKVEHPIPFVPDVSMRYTPMDLSGLNTTSSGFTFGNTSYQANAASQSDMSIDTLDLTLYYHLPLLEMFSLDTLDLRGGVAMRQVEGETSIRQDTAGVSKSHDFTAYVPLAYVGATLEPVDWLAVSLDVYGVKLSGHHWYDATLQGQYGFFDNWAFLGAGYRYQSLKLEDVASTTIDATVGGPFAEAGLRF